MSTPAGWEAKAEQLRAWLEDRRGVLVAFSGGVDSGFLCAAAVDALGPRALAVTADSPALPRRELAEARALARTLGIQHRVVPSRELSNPCYAANPPNRCYYCKSDLYAMLRRIAAEAGIATVADGTNRDDDQDVRPGTRAARAWGVQSPLHALGFTKADIRAASRARGLPSADKPAAACLASRFPFGEPISADGLQAVEQAEEVLRIAGFRQVRVRVHHDLARIELGPDELCRALQPGCRTAIVEGVRACGFRFVALDLEGYRPAGLPPPPAT